MTTAQIQDQDQAQVLKEAAELLSTGASADIWYDARDYGDTQKEELITSVQHAMDTLSEAVPKMVDTFLEVESLLASHPEANVGNSKVHYVLCKLRAVLPKAS